MKTFLKLPLRFRHFFDKEKMPVCNMQESIYRNLHLIITTVQGEHRAQSGYGSSFWDYDYDIHLTNDARREIIINGLKQQIAQYEKRITNVDVIVNVKQGVLNLQSAAMQKRRIEIIVNARIKRSLEPISFQTGFFIGPFTLA
ncbi:GPW/gp25 family protein [Niabella insulamsoli]|uniref:GPW/gp25 family protein n=1 Tax=Niabella insulamsoli TaxID=3144874 RepID=UPI0031FCBB8D